MQYFKQRARVFPRVERLKIIPQMDFLEIFIGM